MSARVAKSSSSKKSASSPARGRGRKGRGGESLADEPRSSAAGSASQDGEEADGLAGDGDGAGTDFEVEPDIIEVEAELVDATYPEPKISRQHETGLARYDALQAYMREVQAHPLLSPEEEHSLAVRYNTEEDLDAAARLVTANLRLVVKIAYEYRRAYRNMMDLIQEGNMGLMQAVKKFDPYRGVKLSSYAAWWIRAYMLRYILNNWRLVKIGTTQAQRKLFFNLSKEKARLTAMGIEPTTAEIAKRLEVEEKEVIEMDRRLARGDASLDAPMGDSDGRPTTRMDLLPTTTVGPDACVEGAELQEMVRERLDVFRTTLEGKELIIFDRRLVAEDPVTLQDLGDDFGISRERVRQLEARLIGKLREFLTASLGDAVQIAG